MLFRFILVICIASFGAFNAAGETPLPSAAVVVPVEAELLSHINAHTLKTGSSVYARVVVDWLGPGCTLHKGATLEAEVRSVVPHSSRVSKSEIALAFQKAQCGRSELGSLTLVLAAVAAPEDTELGSVTTDLPTTVGASSGTGRLRSFDQQVDPLLLNVHRFPAVPSLASGSVLGIRGLKLTPGTGAENNSVLWRSGHDVELNVNTRLLLVLNPYSSSRPHLTGLAKPIEAGNNPTGLVVRTQPAEPGQLVTPSWDACAPPTCSLVSSAHEAGIGAQGTGIHVDVEGFAPRLRQEIVGPVQDEAIAYLGPSQLLIAFNPHTLIPRGGAGSSAAVRVVRAALIDVSSHKITRSVDWRLSDNRQFLWALPRNRVLLHVGNELRLCGKDLKAESRFAISGDLAFVRISPDGKTFAVGITQERYAPELRAKLRNSLGEDPEEDVQVLILNERFETIATTTSTSNRLPPTLLNEGQVKLFLQSVPGGFSGKRYQLELRTWEDQRQILAKFASTCTPAVSSFDPDLLLLVTCSIANGARDYRILRPNGSFVLNGQSLLQELGHGASGESESRAFVIRIFEADEPILPGETFHPAELQSARLDIYHSQDGKRIFSVHVKDPSPSVGDYAISSGAGQLAVLTRTGIDIYAIPAK
ncbi:hypothetical protein P8935_21680 [Telmatobacter sp. DSM 110680]|uniref:Uncharacterized protein n=1 Tax=Telmatobacter sp. DSM 110680 TaxID=3036704 RepID=A0AAU7DH54_9BACT